MPSASGSLVHQLTLDHESESIDELCEAMNSEEFLIFQQWYRRRTLDGDQYWQDRGFIIINTHHIGKVQEYIESITEETYNDESQRNSGISRQHSEGPRRPLRLRGGPV
jgi:hypothetical protein